MENSFVIAVALGVAVVVLLLVLVAIIIYQRWRINDNNAHLKSFLDGQFDENMEMRDKLRQYENKSKVYGKYY